MTFFQYSAVRKNAENLGTFYPDPKISSKSFEVVGPIVEEQFSFRVFFCSGQTPINFGMFQILVPIK